uniref:Light-regulated protein n=1 Tax=Picea sitchensis TaxID=3332 RepID=A9NPG3_PICSI|nr:unknown [Picea sitchensis]ABK27109.1 unknown [Picea sitchensis]
MQATLALSFSASWPILPHTHHKPLPLSTITLTKNVRRFSQHRWRAMATNPTVDYDSSAKSVFPAEACDTVGGEACEGEIGAEVTLKVDSPPTSSPGVGIDREYVEYASELKTVFPGEACDDLGGEFCEPEYQSGVYKEKEPAK